MRRRPWLVVSLMALCGVLLLGAFPLRGYLDQQNQRKALVADVARLAEENGRLDDLVTGLQSDDTIERLARDRYHMVRPGEESYAILPEAAPVPAVTPAPVTPAEVDKSWLSRTWSRITSIL